MYIYALKYDQYLSEDDRYLERSILLQHHEHFDENAFREMITHCSTRILTARGFSNLSADCVADNLVEHYGFLPVSTGYL